jgi:hypothetical protein
MQTFTSDLFHLLYVTGNIRSKEDVISFSRKSQYSESVMPTFQYPRLSFLSYGTGEIVASRQNPLTKKSGDV